MDNQQIIITTPDIIMSVVRKAIAEERASQARRSQRPMTADDLAAHYGCSRSTIWRKVKAGELPQPIGKRWTEGQITSWDNDRTPQNVPHDHAQAA